MSSLTAIDELAQAVDQAVAWAAGVSMPSWMGQAPQPGLWTSATGIRELLRPLTIAVAVLGFMYQGIRLMFVRRTEPLVAAGRGLLSVALWGAIGVVASQLLLQASDQLSTWLLTEVSGAGVPEVRARLGAAFSLSGIPAPMAVVLLGMAALAAIFAQTVLMMAREFAVVVIAVCLQLSAATALTGMGMRGLSRVLGWAAALLVYQPVTAMVYALSYRMLTTDSRPSPASFFTAATALAVSLAALPALMRFFQWGMRPLAGVRLRPALNAVALDARAISTVLGGGRAESHARFMTQSLRSVPEPLLPAGAQRPAHASAPMPVPAVAPPSAEATASRPRRETFAVPGGTATRRERRTRSAAGEPVVIKVRRGRTG